MKDEKKLLELRPTLSELARKFVDSYNPIDSNSTATGIGVLAMCIISGDSKPAMELLKKIIIHSEKHAIGDYGKSSLYKAIEFMDELMPQWRVDGDMVI